MKPVILEQLLERLANSALRQRTPDEALKELREDVDHAWETMEDIHAEELQTSEPIPCEEARLRLGLVEQLLCAVLAKAGELVGPEIDSVRFATRVVQGMAAALPQGGEMPSDVLYFMLTPPEMILYGQFFQPAPKAAVAPEPSVQ